MTYYTTTTPSGRAVIIRINGDAMTSFAEDPENVDYIDYLAWVAEGNTPEPWPPAE